MVETMPEYRPATGSNPPMLAYAIPSGIEEQPGDQPSHDVPRLGTPQAPAGGLSAPPS